MRKLRKGDIVARKSYGKDIIFIVQKIIKGNSKEFAILKGLTLRIEADAPIDDLEIVENNCVQNQLRNLDTKLEKKITECMKKGSNCLCILNKSFGNRSEEKEVKGKVLHLDGDKKYSEKSVRYYKSLGIDAVVKNVAENKQPLIIKDLLTRYKPDILIITGHDGMIRNGQDYNNIYNYRNSRHFINTVREARIWAKEKKSDLVIFAGACQSYFEALINAGANFASSPARVLIDFLDPLVVAEKIATTDSTKYITIKDIENEIRDGTKGVGGIGARGKKYTIFL